MQYFGTMPMTKALQFMLLVCFKAISCLLSALSVEVCIFHIPILLYLTISLSDFLTLKWHSRRPRTPYKVVGISITKSCIDTNTENDNELGRNLNGNFPLMIKDNDGCEEGPNDIISQHHGCMNGLRREFD